MKTAWQLTEQEVEDLSIPYRKRKGIHKSLNGLNTIEFKTNTNTGSAGLAHTFEFFVNGKKQVAPFVRAQKLMFELPDDYGYFVSYGFIQLYAQENNLL